MTTFQPIAPLASRRRAALLWGASLATLISAAAAPGARAQSLGALMAATHQTAAVASTPTPPVAGAVTPAAAAMAAASARALRAQTQINQTVSIAQQAQAAARAAAAALTSTVPNGLIAGGLQPVANPVAAAADPTGLNTWQGAAQPVASNGGKQVTVVQTDPRAVLSWTSFNVGAQTTLTFQQSANGVDQPSWTVLNRVVGQLNPLTGLRDRAGSPTQILGAIKAPGAVFVLDQNGILFGATAQVNVGSLVASSLEIGHAQEFGPSGQFGPISIATRNSEFLNYGLLGYAQQRNTAGGVAIDTFSGQNIAPFIPDPLTEGEVRVAAGASLNSADGGSLILLAPRVTNAGQLTSSNGEIALQSGREVQITASAGDANSVDPDVRGLVVSGLGSATDTSDSVTNTATGIIQAPRGYISLGATASKGTVTQAGVITSTTSVSRNGYVNLFGQTIALSAGAVISIGADTATDTIPQDATSLGDFKTSRVRIGDGGAIIDIGANSLIYAPGGNIAIGADPGATFRQDATSGQDRVVVEAGATIDAAGLTDVLIKASRNAIKISPVKGNELANSPAFRNGFLNGATVYLDPRLSGVNANGVAWVGSPLIAAAAYAQQVGVSASELLTKGGNITLGGAVYSPGTAPTAPVIGVSVKPGATLDIAGGWKTYQAGPVQQSYLVNASGQVVPISQASLNDTYVALYNGYVDAQPRWNISRTYIDPLLTGDYAAGQYSEGMDAGSLTIKATSASLDGALFAAAYAGPLQISKGATGTASGTVFGDLRHLQGASSQLPSGGYLDIQAQGLSTTGDQVGGGDIRVVDGADFAALASTSRLTTLFLNADSLSASGLGQITAQTTGRIDVASGASLILTPGGTFKGLAGGAITINGTVSAASGTIDLATANLGGSVFDPQVVQPGVFDITVNGHLSAAGRWTNDFNLGADAILGPAYQSGGQITLTAAPRVYAGGVTAAYADPVTGADRTLVDASGSLIINSGALIDVSGGGYVNAAGVLSLAAKGGNLSLYDDTTYFQISNITGFPVAGGLSGFRVTGPLSVVAVNPSAINAHVSIADGSIRAQGFGGGGTFTLTTPSFAFGASSKTDLGGGAVLPTHFFSDAGFASYKITSYVTSLTASTFGNGLGGYNAVLATQAVTLGAGQTLSLNQSYLSPLVNDTQIAALRGLGTGGDLLSVVRPTVATAVWDQKPISLTFGGLIELHVAQGGQVTGAPGASLTVSQLWNEGAIRLPGGAVTQSEALPTYYGQTGVGVRDLSTVTASQALNTPVYLLADLDAGEGIRLGAGSVTDLSGEAIINPRATPRGNLTGANFVDGKVIDGGSLVSTNVLSSGGALFHTVQRGSVYSALPNTTLGVAEILNAAVGARIDLSGAQALFDRPILPDAPPVGNPAVSYAPTPIWSNGGSLILKSGGAFSAATVDAHGGASDALGGILSLLNPVLYQNDPTPGTVDAVSASGVSRAGFASFVALGALTSVGDVTLTLPRSVFVTSPDLPGLTTASLAQTADSYSPVIGAGGRLEIDAPYIGLSGAFQSISGPNLRGQTVSGATGSVVLRAGAIDVTGAVAFDSTVSSATLSTTGDLRLIGVAPLIADTNGVVASTLIGQLSTAGDLTLNAAQVYPTTGSRFSVTALGQTATVAFTASGSTPATPYSAGGSLLVQAANIDQGGVVRAPLGALTLGSDLATTLAPATSSLILRTGSVTSVSADGLIIPYGTTTDQKEWYFTPTVADPLTAPPAGVLRLAGGSVDVRAGATVDLKGGGDVYAYEFISGTGGTRDVLERLNADTFSSTSGFQYPDGRQIYAIVPGLSNAAVAALDPVYSSDYGALYGPSQVGQRIYLNAAPNLSAGWYTLLPAKYALLPGGMRVVQDTGAAVPPPAGGVTQPDGTIVTSGYFGIAGVQTRSPGLSVFDVQSQTVFKAESKIALTYGNANFTQVAAHAGVQTPQLPIDAGRLILDPVNALALNAPFLTTPATGGRGSKVDIAGASLTIDPASAAPATPGTIVLTDATLANLHASSLLLGGVRTDNADGTTSLGITSGSITINAGASLSAPEILLATDGASAQLTIADGASLSASGVLPDQTSGAYVIEGLSTDGITQVQGAQGGVVRVANGPARRLTRSHVDAFATAGGLTVGAATLSGSSVAIDAYGGLSISDQVGLNAVSLSIGAGSLNFAAKGSAGGGLLIKPSLQAILGQASSLTLTSRQRISLVAGTYAFNDLNLDAPGLLVRGGGGVSITANRLGIANSGLASGACGATAGLPCGPGSLTLSATQIAFGAGTFRTYTTDLGVSLNASQGVFVDATAVFDVGAANLNLNTPFLGDRGTGSGAVGLTLNTTGAVSIARPAGAGAFTAPSGTPGAKLVIQGGASANGAASISVSGTQVRATAGSLTLTSATGVAVSGGAVLSTPGYQKVFGDSADPTPISAPGGALSVTALAGDIAVSSDSRVEIGGDQGRAGSLSLVAHNGRVYAYGASGGVGEVPLSAVISAQAPAGGASLTLDTGGAFDLSTFVATSGSAFTGDISVRTGAGDLVLSAGKTLKAANIVLVANGVSTNGAGGMVDIGGTLDVSAASGGDVTLYGAQGVRLRAGALIDAHANGNGLTSTLQAKGGDVQIGVDGAGAIAVDTGAKIDVAARQTGDRLINLNRQNATDYTYVAGDAGGTLTFRAPVIDGPGGNTVRVQVDGSVVGASAVTVEGFRRFDLSGLADSSRYVGVSISDGVATLDLAATKAGRINPLADSAGPVAKFVQTFDISSGYRALGGLASQANFHARPGIELDYAGDIVLNSNWNLGAGVVDVAGAVGAGLMAPIAALPGRYSVVTGSEGQILASFTTATYRVGGRFSGEAGVLSFRAGGALDLKYSVSDGFFQFGDQTDPGYLNFAGGGGDRVYQGSISTGCATGDCSTVGAFSPDVAPNNYVNIVFPGSQGLTADTYFNPPAPYSAVANSPAALGSQASNGGDPLGSAQIFPLLTGAGGSRAVASWSYRLTAGADLTGSAGGPSVDPLAINPASRASVILEGEHAYGYSATRGTVSFAPSLNLQDLNSVSLPVDQWLQAFRSADQSGLSNNAYTIIDYSGAPGKVRNGVGALAKAFFKANPQDTALIFPSGAIETSLGLAADFLNYVSTNFASISPNYVAPSESLIVGKTFYAAAPTLVRTGTGTIKVAAPGNIDLRNGSVPTIVDAFGNAVAAPKNSLYLGGSAIYTAGHLADLTSRLALDVSTGQMVTVDPGAGAMSSANFNSDPASAYRYGMGQGFAGILIGNPVYAEGGGEVTLDAGVDVLSRRNLFQENRLGGVGLNPSLQARYSWIGSGDQAWRTGAIGASVDLRINPQLFSEGVGTLAGGDIIVRAGRDIADLSVVATDSLLTAATSASGPSSALVMFGGGDISVSAGRDILGGRVDLANGNGAINALGAVTGAGSIVQIGLSQSLNLVDNTLRARLSNGGLGISATGRVTLQGIGALGVVSSTLNSSGFYAAGSGISILTDQAISVANVGNELLTNGGTAAGGVVSAVYPGSLTAISTTGGITLSTSGRDILLTPDTTGTLILLAGQDLVSAPIAQLDSDPGLLPGPFSSFSFDGTTITNGVTFAFPAVLPNTPDVTLRAQHRSTPTHQGDGTPNRIVAGGDISGAILSLAKQSRISAGRDITNMVFFGQNIAITDVTRVTAGRDITATTRLDAPLIGIDPQRFGAPLPTVQGNTFVLGGPGALFVEAGRDAGPFLNSAVTNGFTNGGAQDLPTGVLTYSGGIVTVGNLRNPWLNAQSADIYAEFGVAKGENFQGLINTYLDPSNYTAANRANQPAYAFLQTTDANGAQSPDRTKPIYALSLVDWVTSIAPDIVNRYDTSAGVLAPGTDAPALVRYAQSLVQGQSTTFNEALGYLPQLADRKLPLIPWLLLNDGGALKATYGTEQVDYAQAFATFSTLPALQQRQFLLKDVYFNELIQTSIPDSGSYLKYSRGYTAVDTLFPGSAGYTQNSLSGGPAGAASTVATGDLDLRLATIQTDQGGDIVILGPGGRVLAGSTVSTSVQASRRAYAGGRLAAGNLPLSPYTAAIQSIPVAYEGVLTLSGGGIEAFTDRDFLLNQSRTFTEAGGDIAIWSSNADVNAGQGAKTTAAIPPVVVRIDENGFSTVNASGAVSGAGIGAFQPDRSAQAPDVFLIAPRGTVDAGDAGVRSAGNVFIAAFQVANANAIQAQGTVSGDQSAGGVNVGVQSSGDAAATAAAQAAQAVTTAGSSGSERPLIVVDVLGFLADESDSCSDDDRKRGKCF